MRAGKGARDHRARAEVRRLTEQEVAIRGTSKEENEVPGSPRNKKICNKKDSILTIYLANGKVVVSTTEYKTGRTQLDALPGPQPALMLDILMLIVMDVLNNDGS